MNGYELSRGWFDFAFENPAIVKPAHCAVYFWVIELANRMGWPKEFANPTSQAMAACGISSYNTYKKTFDELVEWKFINLIKPSANQYQSCIVALSKNNRSLYKSLDKSLTNHSTNQVVITDSINKPQTTNKETNKLINIAFDVFWDAYGRKEGKKQKCAALWESLKDDERQAIIDGLPAYIAGMKDITFQPYPQTFLNGRYFENDSFRKAQAPPQPPRKKMTKADHEALFH